MLAKKLRKLRKLSSLSPGFLFFIASVALLFLFSCSEKAPDKAAPATAAQKTGKTSAEKVIKSDIKDQKKQDDVKEVYNYNPNGKVDPFVPTISETTEEDILKQKAGMKSVEQDIPMTPLQKLDVDDFTLVAVIATPTGYCALLEDPAMNGYKIQEGMQIGRKAGIVKKILHNSVIVEENSDIDKKDSEKKINTLTLRKK